MAAVAAAWFKPEVEAADFAAVDDRTDVEHDVVVSGSEVEIGGESAVVAEPAFSQACTAFEGEVAIGEDLRRVEQVQQMILGDIQ